MGYMATSPGLNSSASEQLIYREMVRLLRGELALQFAAPLSLWLTFNDFQKVTEKLNLPSKLNIHMDELYSKQHTGEAQRR